MLRVVILSFAATALIGSAQAQTLPDIDIKAHCADVGGDAKRIAACTVVENQARLWLEKHRIDPRVLYQCTQTLDLATAGYVLLRSCILAKHRE